MHKVTNQLVDDTNLNARPAISGLFGLASIKSADSQITLEELQKKLVKFQEDLILREDANLEFQKGVSSQPEQFTAIYPAQDQQV